MRINLDIHGNIIGVFAARNDNVAICRNNLSKLFSLHEKTVHDLAFRTETGETGGNSNSLDLFEFLKTPCLKALYHDRFESLLDCSSELIKNSAIKANIEAVLDGMKLNEHSRKEIFEQYNGSDLKVRVEEMVDSFLSYNGNHLPMFAKPGTI